MVVERETPIETSGFQCCPLFLVDSSSVLEPCLRLTDSWVESVFALKVSMVRCRHEFSEVVVFPMGSAELTRTVFFFGFVVTQIDAERLGYNIFNTCALNHVLSGFIQVYSLSTLLECHRLDLWGWFSEP